MFFDDFQDVPPPPIRPGWKIIGGPGQGGSGYLPLGPGAKMIAGDAKWTDYVLEGRVMLKGETSNAGLVFRVNDAISNPDRMRAYYVGFDTRKLYLGKMNKDWQPLAEFDLGKLECKVVSGAWNQIRVAVEGPRIHWRPADTHRYGWLISSAKYFAVRGSPTACSTNSGQGIREPG